MRSFATPVSSPVIMGVGFGQPQQLANLNGWLRNLWLRVSRLSPTLQFLGSRIGHIFTASAHEHPYHVRERRSNAWTVWREMAGNL